MSDLEASLTHVARSVFSKRGQQPVDPWGGFLSGVDPLLDEAREAAYVPPMDEVHEVERLLLDEPDIGKLAVTDGRLGPMVLHAGGGHRLMDGFLTVGLLSSASQRMFFSRLPVDEATYVRTVLDGLGELRRACKEGKVSADLIEGVTGVSLPEGSEIKTPWGVMRPAPRVSDSRIFLPAPHASCLLVDTRVISVVFDNAPQPEHDFDRSEVSSERARMLLPLACALATREGQPAVPILTWSTLLLPFEASHGYSSSLISAKLRGPIDLAGREDAIEEWGSRVEASHVPTVDVAARRLASAVGYRFDRGDALVDAVMVWENLVGSDVELSFRVTAALAKLVESEPSKRRQLQKELKKIYSVRSKIVHGSAVDTAEADLAAAQALDVAVRALRACYTRGRDWLARTSTDRADTLLMEEP